MKPFVKWAGGKRQILERINEFIEGSLEGRSINDVTYFEPFLGGGAVFLKLKPSKAVVNDLNSDLINAYKVIRSNDYLLLIEELKEYQRLYREEDRDELYYTTRELDRNKTNWNNLTDVQKAARMIFLNRTCYNGLYRVNSQGYFNTPIGRYVNPLICDENNIKELHEYLSKNEIKIMCASYEECIKKAKYGDIVYVDPPYDYEDDDGFTKYQMKGFTFEDFKKLKLVCDEARRRGAYVIISNNATERVLKLFYDDPNYKVLGYETNKFATLRNINCKGDSRKSGNEVIIWGIPFSVPLPQANDMDKIIKLTELTDEQIKDKKYIAEKVLNFTERQAAYYCAALKFFGYLNNADEYTDRLKELREAGNVVSDIKNQMYGNEDIKYVLSSGISKDVDEISKYLYKKYKKKYDLNEATARRRASTIKAWIDWGINN